MFSAVLMYADPDRARRLRALMLDTRQLQVLRKLADSPNDYELTRILNTFAPDLMLVDMRAGHVAL